MRGAAALALLALAACSPEPAVENKAVEATPSATPAPVAEPKAAPEPDRRFDFAGVWAPTPAECAAEGTWRLSREEVATGEASCTVDAIRNETATRATLDLSCDGSKERWELFAAPEDGLTVQRYSDEVMTEPQQRLARCD